MFCNACGKFHERIDDFLMVEGEVVCKALYQEQEDFYRESLKPVWLGGLTNEEGEVYGG